MFMTNSYLSGSNPNLNFVTKINCYLFGSIPKNRHLFGSNAKFPFIYLGQFQNSPLEYIFFVNNRDND